MVEPKVPTAATWWVSGGLALPEECKCYPESPLTRVRANFRLVFAPAVTQVDVCEISPTSKNQVQHRIASCFAA